MYMLPTRDSLQILKTHRDWAWLDRERLFQVKHKQIKPRAHVCSATSVLSDSLWLYGLFPTKLPFPWDSPGKNTGVGCQALLQGVFLTQGSKSHLPSSPALQADSLPTEQPGKPQTKVEMKVKVAQSCPALCDLMDYTVHGILQVRILEWVAFPFSWGSSQTQGLNTGLCIAGRFFTNWEWHQTKKFLHSKRNRQSEKTTYGVGKILNNISYESLISQIYKEIIKFNSKKTPI